MAPKQSKTLKITSIGWLLFLLLSLSIWVPTASLADEASDIARLLELADDHQETMTQFRAGKITLEAMRERTGSIKAERNAINNAHGKWGSKERKAWNKKTRQAQQQHKQKQIADAAAKADAEHQQAAAEAKAAANAPLVYKAKPGENFAGVAPADLAKNLAANSRMTPQDVLQAFDAIEIKDVGVELRGMRLGMKPKEAMAALKAIFPDHAIIDEPRYFTVPQSAGLWPPGKQATADTPGAYADKAKTINNITKDIISIEFALPPSPNVVLSITRNHTIQFSEEFNKTKTSIEVYRNALIAKYGPPTKEIPAGPNRAILKWLYPANDMDCIGGIRGAIHPQTWVFRDAAKAADCATTLIYSLVAGSDGVVTAATARLANAGHMFFTTQLNRSLREEVRKIDNAAKRQQATDAPKL